MKWKTSGPGAAIATGLGMIAFALFHAWTGIFPYRTAWKWRSVTRAEDPAGFRIAVLVTILGGAAILIWGLRERRRRRGRDEGR